MKRFFIFLLVLGLIMVTACSEKEEDLLDPITIYITQDHDHGLELVAGEGAFFIQIEGAKSKPEFFINNDVENPPVLYPYEGGWQIEKERLNFEETYQFTLLIDDVDERDTSVKILREMKWKHDGALPNPYNGSAKYLSWSVGSFEGENIGSSRDFNQHFYMNWTPNNLANSTGKIGAFDRDLGSLLNLQIGVNDTSLPAGWQTLTVELINYKTVPADKEVTFILENSLIQTVESSTNPPA